MLKFNELGLISPLLAAVEKQGYETPTPIQQQAIPQILQKKDLFAIAPTGTGKTAAFAMPILQDIMENPQREPHALVLAPTRELAHQIADNFRKYAEGTKLYIALVYGGVSQINQVKDIRRGAHIIIATPGRLLDLIEQGHINLSKVKTFVLDECDRMLDMGFISDIREIGNLIKTENRQTLLFSATAAREIRDLAADMLVEPAYIDIAPESHQKPNINQLLYAVDRNDKYDLLKDLIEEQNIDQVLVFTKTKHGADRLVQNLNRDDYFAVAIHGDKSQRERSKNLDLFKRGRARILVATDVAARGVDIKELNYVLNYDMALDTDTHTHRIGRTGRAGATGTAISFSDNQEARFVRDVLKQQGQDSMTMMEHQYHIEIPWRKPPQKGRRSDDAERSSRGGRGNGQSRNEGSRNGSSNSNGRRDGKGGKKSFQPFSDSFNLENNEVNSYNNRGSEFRVIDNKKSKNKNGGNDAVNPNTGNKPTKNLNKQGSNFDDMEFLIIDELFKERSNHGPKNSETKEKGNNKKANGWGSTRKNDGGEFFSDSRPSNENRRSGGGRDFSRSGNGGSYNRNNGGGNRNGGNRAERRSAEFGGGSERSSSGYGRNANGGGGRSSGGYGRSEGNSRGGYGGGRSNGGGYGRNSEGSSRGEFSRGGESRGGESRGGESLGNGGYGRSNGGSSSYGRGGSSSRSGSSYSGGSGRSGGAPKRKNPAGHKNKFKAAR